MPVAVASPSPGSPGPSPHQYELGPKELQKHMLATYFYLRAGMVVMAFGLPVLLWLIGAWRGVGLQGSMSAYYHADTVTRNVFVGLLVAVGAFLYLYEGFSKAENYALNFAGIFVVGVAMFPMEWNCGTSCARFSLHGTLAVLFFLCIAYVCLFRAADTLTLMPNEEQVTKYKRTYRTVGSLLVLSPLAAVVVSAFLERPGQTSPRVFFIEAFGVWIFALYWLLKSREMRHTDAELLALAGRGARVKAPRPGKPDKVGIVKAP